MHIDIYTVEIKQTPDATECRWKTDKKVIYGYILYLFHPEKAGFLFFYVCYFYYFLLNNCYFSKYMNRLNNTTTKQSARWCLPSIVKNVLT